MQIQQHSLRHFQEKQPRINPDKQDQRQKNQERKISKQKLANYSYDID
jgi:hypothetical protein